MKREEVFVRQCRGRKRTKNTKGERGKKRKRRRRRRTRKQRRKKEDVEEKRVREKKKEKEKKRSVQILLPSEMQLLSPPFLPHLHRTEKEKERKERKFSFFFQNHSPGCLLPSCVLSGFLSQKARRKKDGRTRRSRSFSSFSSSVRFRRSIAHPLKKKKV